MGSESAASGLELKVLDVIRETEDAVSVVFDSRLEFKPGQFLTLAVPSARTGLVARCYSLCSVPGEPLTVTVKRTAEGYASGWINDNLRPGETMRVLEPSGIFTPASLDADLLLLAGGSGVTPIMSIARTALVRGSGRITVLYANRDERSVIFARQWAELAAAHPDRLEVIHWLESVQGLPSQAQLRAFASRFTARDAFVCGPAPFMKLATAALKELGFPRERRHQERFVSLGGNPFGDLDQVQEAAEQIAAAESDEETAGQVAEEGEPAGRVADEGAQTAGRVADEGAQTAGRVADEGAQTAGRVADEGAQTAGRVADEGGVSRPGPVRLSAELDGRTYEYDDWSPTTTVLEHLESKGVKAPYSCREGECSACAFRLLDGEVKMLKNDVLETEDLDDGIRLGCQSVPVTDSVSITYS